MRIFKTAMLLLEPEFVLSSGEILRTAADLFFRIMFEELLLIAMYCSLGGTSAKQLF